MENIMQHLFYVFRMMAVGGVHRTCGRTSQYIMQNVALQLTSLWSINNRTSDHVSTIWATYSLLIGIPDLHAAVSSSEHASDAQCK